MVIIHNPRGPIDFLNGRLNHYLGITTKFASVTEIEDFLASRTNAFANHIKDEIFKNLIGAKGEELLLGEMKQLPDEFHLFSGFEINLFRSFFCKKLKQYIKSSQIDHLLISSKQIYLIEVKNYPHLSLITTLKRKDGPIKQILRAEFLLSKLLFDKWNLSVIPVKILTIIQNFEHFQQNGVQIVYYLEIVNYIRKCENN